MIREFFTVMFWIGVWEGMDYYIVDDLTRIYIALASGVIYFILNYRRGVSE